MALYYYVAVDAQGKQFRGEMESDNVAELKELLHGDKLFLVSAHLTESSGPSGDEDLPGPKGPERKIDERDWPVKTPSQYVMMSVVFVVCVILGYFLGR